MRRLEFIAPTGFPLLEPGQPLVPLILSTLSEEGIALNDGDVLILAQKIVSKSENRFVDLNLVRPSDRARELARACGKDPRLVEVILSESTTVARCCPGVIIVRHRLGLMLANAGIDQSNIPSSETEDRVLLLPENPDQSCAEIREALVAATGAQIGVLIIDSIGRAWRIGTCGICIGAAGVTTVQDLRGSEDLFGRVLASTIIGFGDELAAAASVLMGQAAEGLPIVVAKGLEQSAAPSSAHSLVRPVNEDLFS